MSHEMERIADMIAAPRSQWADYVADLSAEDLVLTEVIAVSKGIGELTVSVYCHLRGRGVPHGSALNHAQEYERRAYRALQKYKLEV